MQSIESTVLFGSSIHFYLLSAPDFAMRENPNLEDVIIHKIILLQYFKSFCTHRLICLLILYQKKKCFFNICTSESSRRLVKYIMLRFTHKVSDFFSYCGSSLRLCIPVKFHRRCWCCWPRNRTLKTTAI